MHEPLPRDDYNASLTPTRLEPPTAPAPPEASNARGFTQAAAFGLLGLLGVGVLAVFYWLPRWVAAPIQGSAQSVLIEAPLPPILATDSSTNTLLPEPLTARPAAQEVLARLLSQVEALRAQRIDVWGPGELTAIEALVAEGEQAYREQRFTAARQTYLQAAKSVEAAVARIPSVIADYLEQGERALRSQDPRAAEMAFSVTLSLAPDNEPDHERAQRGLRRAETFDRVQALLTEAQGYERMDDSKRAASAYREALKLDPEADAKAALSRLERAEADARFSALMSKGFAALEGGNYAEAESTFAQTLEQRPQSSEATNALAQTKARASAARIETALATAKRAEQNEQWTAASTQYRAALAVDEGLELAAQGDERVRQREALEERLRVSLRHPERLADNAVYREAEGVLREARAARPGKRLTSQIAALDALLIAARTPVKVTLNSDGATDVALLKAGKLGRFTEHALTLFPGRYTAVGTRSGYRDIRVEFTVAADAAPIITVQCQEALSFGR